jgi:folate-binding protein YgfZ
MTTFQTAIQRDRVRVTGPDATSFLQSLLSQDLDAIGVGESAASLLLQPQGKLLVAFRALHVGPEEWWLLCDRGFGEKLAEGLARFKIRIKAEIAVDDVRVLAVRGVDVAPDVPAAFVDVVREGSWSGFDLVQPDDPGPDDRDAYERARIEAGVPSMGSELDETTIPQEAFLDRDAVSFTKGCFVGQELVCRIDTRGHVNRYLRRLRTDDALAVGDDVVYEGKVVGRVTSSAGDVGLAMLRREVEPGATVDVNGARANVEAV